MSITAEAHSDDYVVEVAFDAAPYFAQASNDEIVALARIGWGGDYDADAVAEWTSETHRGLAELFAYLDRLRGTRRACGFECHVEPVSAMTWLAAHRPQLAQRIEQDGW